MTKPFNDKTNDDIDVSNSNSNSVKRINNNDTNNNKTIKTEKPSMLRPAYLINNNNQAKNKLLGDKQNKQKPTVNTLTCSAETCEESSNDGQSGIISEVPSILKRFKVNVLSGRGSKYWLAGEIMNILQTAFADSAADVSLFPKNRTNGMKLQKLEKPFEITGFKEKQFTLITHTVDIEFHFKPGVLKATFYVCDCKSMIIGSDLLQDMSKDISLITGDRCFKVNGFKLNTARSETAAKREFMRRSRMDLTAYMNEFEDEPSDAMLRTRDKVYLPPHRCIEVRAYLSGKEKITDSRHSLLSYFDHSSEEQGHDELFIPSLSFSNVSTKSNRMIPITNISKRGFFLPKNFVVGKIVTHAPALNINSCEIFNVDEIRDEIEFRKNRDDTSFVAKSVDSTTKAAANIATVGAASTAEQIRPNAHTTSVATTTSAKATADDSVIRPAADLAATPATATPATTTTASPDRDRNCPAKFSDLVGVNKLDQETFEQCRTHGVTMDYKIEQIKPNVEVTELFEPDYEAEKEKAKNCPYWKDKDKFLKCFEYSHMDSETEEFIKNLLWDYRHIWYAEEFPEQFRLGLQNVTPVKIDRIPGAVPRREPLRQLSNEKLKILQRHMDDLMDQGVLVEEPSGHFSSPVHLVLEERYSAKHGKNVRKARVTVDLRSMNQTIFPLCYPIPSVEEFRRHMSEYTYFSCVDGKAWFHQIPVEEASSKACFCVRACGKIYRLIRLCMGAKVSPSISQCLVDLMFKHHENCRVYLDDLTTFSHTLPDHFKHLEKTFAYCSFYNILLSPNKAHLVTKSIRSLGMQISSKEISMCSEKIQKIEEIQFPKDKKGLISILAFFQYFNRVCPRLSEYTAPLRRLALPSVRFKPEAVHIEAFEKAKKHLLDSKVTAVRSPSPNLDDLIYVFTDASSSALGAVLAQQQWPDENATEKELYLVGTFSSVIPELWENYAVWVKELLALFECSRKFRWLLLGRNFIVITDSSVLSYWTNLTLIPKDLARKILALQQFQFKLLFIESRANPADVISRISLPDMQENRGIYEKFLENQIINSKGENVPIESLYSERKQKEILQFFTKNRKQQLSHAISSEEMKRKKEETNEQYLYDSKFEQEDNCFVMDGDEITVEVVEADETEQTLDEQVSSVSARSEIVVSSVDLDDSDQSAGRVEILIDEPPTVDLPSTIQLPIYGDKELSKIKEMQNNDHIINQVKMYVRGEIEQPSKIQAMALAGELKDFLRHKSNFRISNQGVLIRVWIYKDGSMVPLIVVKDEAFQKLLTDLHNFDPNNPSSLPHMGSRRTFAALSETFYCFKMREKVIRFIANCPVCHLDNHVAHTMKEDKGEQIAFEPMDLMIADYIGPLKGWANTSGGHARYVFMLTDANSRYTLTYGTTDVSDESTFAAILQIRKELCGLPKRIAADNAIFRENSAARKFLEEAGVSILHGKATISRDQSKVERAISSITRTLCKLHSECPKISFERILSEATIAHNSSICRSTGRSPREAHFVRPASNFLNINPKDVQPRTKTLKDAITAARTSSRRTLVDEVEQFIKRNELTSPTQFTKRLIPNDIVLKKRTSYPLGSPKKLCHKMTIDAYIVIERVASNSYRVRSLIDNKIYILPGDLLVRLRHHSKEDAIQLVKGMQEIVDRNAYRSAASRAADRPMRASRNRGGVNSVGNHRRMQQISALGPARSTDTVYSLSRLFGKK